MRAVARVVNPLSPFFKRSVIDPRRLALKVGGRSVDAGELTLRASRIADWIRSRSSTRVPRVGVLGGRTAETYFGAVGALWARSVYVPMDAQWPAWRIQRIVRDASLDCLVVDDTGGRLQKRFLRGLPCFAADRIEPRSSRPTPPAVREGDEELYLLYTSGSTGLPKGVRVSASNVSAYLDAIERVVRLKADDRVSQFFPLIFDLSMYGLLLPWRTGASLHVVPDEKLLFAADFIRSERLTVWFSTPSLIARLADLGSLSDGSLPSLRLSMFCGEALPSRLAALWAAAASKSRLINLYGPTETTITCLSHVWRGNQRSALDAFVSIGRPHPRMRTGVIPSDGSTSSTTGELILSGPQVCLGYRNNPRLSSEKFPNLRLRGKNVRWYRTGDLVRRDRRRSYYYLGRIDDQVKIAGYRIELGEVEACLRRASGNQSVAALPWPGKEGLAEGIVAFYCGRGSVHDVMRRLRRRLPRYALPRRLIRLKRLPMNLQGKTDRARLARMIGS